jgi:acetolactate synthase small subunit
VLDWPGSTNFIIRLFKRKNKMEQFTKQIEQMFNVDALVDQTEKSMASALTYLPQAEIKETLLTLNAANANFARANLVAAKSFGKAFQTAAEQAQTNLKKAANSK